MPWMVLLPLATVGFWVWHLMAWIIARGRWAYQSQEGSAPLSGMTRPRFMGTLAMLLAHCIMDLTEVLTALGGLFLIALPMLMGCALLLAVLSIVVVPLAGEIGLVAELLAGAVVFGGVSVPFILAQTTLARVRNRP